ncbi:MAG: hypothetical protein LBV69_10020 [Bacteroidales bacterium]|jgi:hypothetical protein|nr:hypothetical protein [Bacteroidales bacterium]
MLIKNNINNFNNKGNRIILFFLLLIFSCTNLSQTICTKYENLNGLLIEIPKDTISAERYTLDNIIYMSNNKYLLTYKFIKNDSVSFFYKIPDNSHKWNFIIQDSINNKDVVSFLILEILPDNKKMISNRIPNYNQTVISYSYFAKIKPDYWIYLEHTGLVENDKNIWLHPPRTALFKILEINPFPFIQDPYEITIGKEWTWSLQVGSGWLDERWYKWEGEPKVFDINYKYKITDKINISTQYYTDIECFVVDAIASSDLGDTMLKSFYNEKKGFVKLEYTNIDNSKIIFEIKKLNDTDN